MERLEASPTVYDVTSTSFRYEKGLVNSEFCFSVINVVIKTCRGFCLPVDAVVNVQLPKAKGCL